MNITIRNLSTFSVLTLATLMSSANATNSTIQPKIYNGAPANIQDSPYMVALIDNTQEDAYLGQFCGGTLIAKNWVVTAAHCVFDEKSANHTISNQAVDILINRSVLSATGGERIAVEHIIVHQAYDNVTLDNDIALIKLKSPAHATPIELLSNFSDQDNAGREGKALGWGATYDNELPTNEYDADYTDELLQASLPIISNASCQQAWDGITSNMLCAGFINGKKDTCHGDSGGSLVIFDRASNTWRQIGITSFGTYCNGRGTYGVYTRVKNYKNLISEVICSAAETPAAPILKKSVLDKQVRLTWNSPAMDTQYQLIYKARNEATPHSITLNNRTEYSVTLPKGADYDVAIKASKGNCVSAYSNIEHVTQP